MYLPCYGVRVVRGSPNPRHYKLPLRLRKARRQAGISSAAVAQRAGISHAIVRYIETEQRLPTVETIERIAVALGLSAAWLAFGLGSASSEGVAATCAGMSERLKVARTERGYTRTDLARMIERSPGTVAGIENGGQAGVDTIEQLAKELRVSPAWLAYGVGDRELAPRRRSRAASAVVTPSGTMGTALPQARQRMKSRRNEIVVIQNRKDKNSNMNSIKASDEDVCSVYSDIIDNYPSLRAALPSRYPYGYITRDKMENFSEHRKLRYWHNINFPMSINMCIHPTDKQQKSLGESILRTLNDFCENFSKLDGFSKTLKPLWGKGTWTTDDPEFWSVLSTACLALGYKNSGSIVTGFAQTIGNGQKDADISILIGEAQQKCHVDIEMWHAIYEKERTHEELRIELERRADIKLGKFQDLPSNELGVVAIICIGDDKLFNSVFRVSKLASGFINGEECLQRERKHACVYWIAQTYTKQDRDICWLSLHSQIPEEIQ